MQVVQTLKFSYDTNLDPEIDQAVEDLVHLIHLKGSMITDGVSPNRGGSTIVFRPADTPKEFVQDLEQFVSHRRAFTIDNIPDDIRQAILEAHVPEEKWACGRKTGDEDCDCQFPQNTSWDSIRSCQR